MDAQSIIKECAELQSAWTTRNQQFKNWFETLIMVDKLKEDKMESFVSNEPRTFYNLALHLLTPTQIVPRIPVEGLSPEDLSDATAIEGFLKKVWLELERLSLRRGRGGFLRELVSFLIATGWYSVFSIVTNEEIIAEVWNPAEVFPEFGDDGLLRVAHVYTASGRAITRKAVSKGWKLEQSYPASATFKCYDYWTIEDGVVANAIVIGTELIKPLTPEYSLGKLPVYCSPVAGLPDRGVIISSPDWRKYIGQSIIATDENIYSYINKLYTFFIQLIRDTAQARWVEKSAGEPKVKPEDIFKRGAVFHLGLGESLEPIPAPSIPVELRAVLFDIGQMRQKGSLPDALYGGVAQPISGYLMQQIAGQAVHILRPYHQALSFLLGELCNDWISDMKQFNLQPYNFKVPKKDLPRVELDIRMDIPGDIVQRATVARMLNPSFSLSIQTVSDMLFPEVTNPMAEQARVQRDKAMQHPVLMQLHLVEALKSRAAMLAEEGDTEMSALYSRAADAILGKEQAPAVSPSAPTPRPEVLPREALGGAEFPTEE